MTIGRITVCAIAVFSTSLRRRLQILRFPFYLKMSIIKIVTVDKTNTQ